MNKADMLIYIHPELGPQRRTDVTRMVEGHVGVDCAEFNQRTHNHALVVKYDPDVIRGMQILDMVRKTDPAASIVGM